MRSGEILQGILSLKATQDLDMDFAFCFCFFLLLGMLKCLVQGGTLQITWNILRRSKISIRIIK